jgi:hypothetical protein
MAFISCYNTVEVALRYALPGANAANVLTFYCSDPLTQALVCQAANQIAVWWESDLRDWQGTHLTLTEIYARDLTDDMSWTCVNSGYTGYHGGYGAGDPLPNNVAACLSLRTRARGRSGRGRQYTTALTTSHIAGNELNSTYLAGIKAAYDRLKEGGDAMPSRWHWCVVSRYHNKQPRDDAAWNAITNTMWVNNVVDSMRRRLPG